MRKFGALKSGGMMLGGVLSLALIPVSAQVIYTSTASNVMSLRSAGFFYGFTQPAFDSTLGILQGIR